MTYPTKYSDGAAMRAVVYARVSVRGEDIENQVKTISGWAKRNGYQIAAVFKDIDVTGASNPLEREAFKALMKFCKDNDVKTILVYDLSRFGRSLPEAVGALRKLLDGGYTVIFTRFNLKADLNDIAGKVMVYTLLMAAELERDFMHMRLEAARLAGKRIGRKPVEIPVDLVKQLLSRGKTIADIHRYLISKGYLKYREKGTERTLSYERFRRKLKQLGITRGGKS